MAVEPIKIYAGDRKMQDVAFTLRFCNEKKIPYEYIDISDDQETLMWTIRQGATEAPFVVLPNGKKFCGFKPDLIKAWATETQKEIMSNW